MPELTVFICPRCQQRDVRMPFTGDFVHVCHTINALKDEEVLVIGDWEDFTGSDSGVHANVLVQGQESTLFGTRADIEGEKNSPNRTVRGFPGNRFRTRQHLHYIEDNFFKLENVKRTDDPEEFFGA